jgi:ABC-type sugar transport system substrate-binding protein
VNQATPDGIAKTLVDHAARLLGGKGEYAIITASLTAGNMVEWQKAIDKYNKEKFPDLKMVALRPCDDKQKQAFDEANNILNARKTCKLLMAICSPAMPGAAEAVEQSGRTDVKVIGLGLPNDNKVFVKKGITEAVVLWKTADLGYLAVQAAVAVHKGTLKTGDKTFSGGRLQNLELQGDNLLLGIPFTFDKTNIDGFDF